MRLRPTGGQKLTAEQVAEALREAKGFVSVAARRLGVAEQTVRNYLSRYEACRQARLDAREAMKDLAESRLLERITKGDVTAIIFFLKTQGKDRGYVERQELTGANDEPLRIKLVWSDGGEGPPGGAA